MLKKYLLKNGRVYWHKLYYDLMPRFMADNHPPLGLYNYAYYVIHPGKYIEAIYYQAKWFLQRGIRGYSDSDMWDWYSYMARTNLAVLQWLAASTYGHPVGMTLKGWRTRLLKMAEGFKAILEDDNDFPSYRQLAPRQYRALLRGRQARLRRGLKLYAECFQALWD